MVGDTEGVEEVPCASLLRFKTPAGILLAGPSQSGKTSLLVRLFKHLPCMFDTTFQSILWCYGEKNAVPKDLETHGIPFRTHEGLPDDWSDGETEALGLVSPALIVLDDLLEVAYNTNSIETLFTKKIHHNKWTVILVSQNLLYQSKIARTISLNLTYMILMKNIRDKNQFLHLARQVEPTHHRGLIKAYDEALMKPYGYFVIDFHVTTPEALRYRSCLFPTDSACIFWTSQDRLEKLKDEKAFEFA